MDAILDEYALELLGASLRKANDADLFSPLPRELNELCDRLRDREGGAREDAEARDSELN